ncbi:MAG TPA: hypothetical protein VIF12_07625 [Micavibrio sp.]|jgi:hypothetical protein
MGSLSSKLAFAATTAALVFGFSGGAAASTDNASCDSKATAAETYLCEKGITDVQFTGTMQPGGKSVMDGQTYTAKNASGETVKGAVWSQYGTYTHR